MSEVADTRAGRLRKTLFAGVGGLAAALASGSYAVYEARIDPGTPQIAAGQPVEAGRWLVTLRSAREASTTPDGRKPFRGAFAVMVDAELLNRSGESSNIFGNLFRLLDPPPGVDPRPTIWLARDAAMAGALQPRLPEKIVVAWTFPEGATPPKTIRVSITGDKFKPKDNLYAAPGWFNPHVVGEASFAVSAEPPGAPADRGPRL